MEEIESIFKNFSSYSTTSEFDRVDQLIKEDYGTRISSKEENGFIDIEYNNRIGEYKAKLLLEYFNKNEGFYKYFLKKRKKIIIGYENNTSLDEIYIDNYPVGINTTNILMQLLNDTRNKAMYITYLIKRIDKNEELVSEIESLNFLKNTFLKNLVDSKRIDFFDYLDLMDGKFINLELFYEKLMVDIAFKNGWYGWLDLYMQGENLDEIRQYILKDIYNQYSIKLFNMLLDRQANELRKYSTNNTCFLESNLIPLKNLFEVEFPKILSRFSKDNSDNYHQRKVSREEIIELVIEFLYSIDDSNTLVNEFKTNLDNGRIILWNQTDTNERRLMSTKLLKFNEKDIDGAACLEKYDKFGNLKDYLVNIPLTYNISDVPMIIHEFFHLHNILYDGKKRKDRILEETPSIYFEKLAETYLNSKGYSKNDININFRVIDSIKNLELVMPVINYLKVYMDNGIITEDMLDVLINSAKHRLANICLEKGLSNEETRKEFIISGLFGNIDEVRYNIVLNLICILLTQKSSIFRRIPYIMGAIITNNAIDNNCSTYDMLKLSDGLNDIDNPIYIMKTVGIDTSKYGFNKLNEVSKRV